MRIHAFFSHFTRDLVPLEAAFPFFYFLLLPAYFLFSSSWSNLPIFPLFPSTCLLPLFFHLEQASGFSTLYSYLLASSSLPLGVIFLFFHSLLLPACFLFSSSFLPLGVIFPVFHSFPYPPLKPPKKAADFHRLPKTLTSTKIRLFL